jgi:hypothetical protein
VPQQGCGTRLFLEEKKENRKGNTEPRKEKKKKRICACKDVAHACSLRKKKREKKEKKKDKRQKDCVPARTCHTPFLEMKRK